MDTTPDTVITVRGLTKRYGEVVALDGLDLDVRRGTVLGLLGPNGAGKTTAVRILATILTADAGIATVDGFDVRTDADEVRARIGLAGQYAAVDESLTGRENLRLVGRLAHLPGAVARRRADELLERFGLTDAGGRMAKTYSGGMRRRLDLAAALVHHPPIVFLDEPTTGLDPSSRKELWEITRELVAEGTTVLLTTQYLEEADRLANRIVVIDHGHAIAEGTASELKAQLGATVLELELADAAEARTALDAVSRLAPTDPYLEGPRLEVTVDGTRDVIELLRTLDDAGIEPQRLALREPSLDDVFLALTGHKTEADSPTVDREPVEVAG